MAYDERLAERVRKALKRRRGIAERKMFGGICFFVNGNMACGVADRELMLRLGNQGAAEALRHPHTREMDFTGKPLKTMVYVKREGLRSKVALEKWVRLAADFARTLPPK